MKIQILGTAAAEGWPGLFCRCEACGKARVLGGKDLRTRSSIQIDDVWKVDFPPDSLYHVHRHGIDLGNLKYLFFTHSHSDHMASEEMALMVAPFGHNALKENPVQVYMHEAAMKEFDRRVGEKWHRPAVVCHALTPFEPVHAGEMTAIPLPADHNASPGEIPLFYVFEKDGKRVLYCSDTGPFSEACWDFILARRFDLVISECTYGPPMEPHRGHMGLGDVVRMKERLAAGGALSAGCPVWITHFSHNAKITHEEFVALAAPYGVEVAYDGVVIEV